MAFPDTAILDDFNRGNETPLVGNWSAPIVSGEASANLVSNEATWSARSSTYWNYQTFGPGIVEVYLTVSTKPDNGNYIAVWAMVNSPGGAGLDGYIVEFNAGSGTDAWGLVRWDNGAETGLANGSQEYSSGDSLGMRILANGNIEVWHKPSAGSWTLVDNSQTDTTYTSGYIGFGTKATGAIDNFSGGAYGNQGGPAIPIYEADMFNMRGVL